MSRRSFAAFVCAFTLALPLSLVGQQTPAARSAAIEAMYPVMIKALESGNFGQARNIADQAILWEPDNPNHHYNLACIEARAGGSRLAQAISALARAAELGFPEIGTLKNDPDLDPIRNDPRFAEIARRVTRNAEEKARTSPPPPVKDSAARTPPSPRGIENTALLAPGESPAPASFAEGVPVGLFFMTRFWSFTGTLEKLVWYFSPDGTVYQSLEYGFSSHDLATHTGPRGQASLQGNKLEIKWSDRKKSSSTLERSETGFFWDGGNFTPVRPFTSTPMIVGRYEGGESISYSGNRAAVSKTLELNPDGTFRWSGVSFLSSTTDASRVTAGANGIDSVGRWHVMPYALVLIDAKGNVYRRIAFPYDDAQTPVTPDWIFFGGTMFKRK